MRQDQRDQAAELKVQRQAEKLDTLRRRFVKALAKYPAGETRDVIRGTAGMSGGEVNLVVPSLLDDGTITVCEVAKPNRRKPYAGYRLAPEATV